MVQATVLVRPPPNGGFEWKSVCELSRRPRSLTRWMAEHEHCSLHVHIRAHTPRPHHPPTILRVH